MGQGRFQIESYAYSSETNSPHSTLSGNSQPQIRGGIHAEQCVGMVRYQLAEMACVLSLLS